MNEQEIEEIIREAMNPTLKRMSENMARLKVLIEEVADE